jgi:hypothetical protein
MKSANWPTALPILNFQCSICNAAKKVDKASGRANVASTVFNTPMSTPSPLVKLRRNLKVLLLLGFVLTAVNIFGGGLLLLLGYSHQEVVEPLWKSGQHVLLAGATNLVVYLGLLFQVRKVWAHCQTEPSANTGAEIEN